MSERALILLPSDKQFDLLDPDLWVRTDDHLATGSFTCRWDGYSPRDLPLSVTHHSLAVLVFCARAVSPSGHSRRELLHDATEALMGGAGTCDALRAQMR